MYEMTPGSVHPGTANGKSCFIAQTSYIDEDGKRRFIRGYGATEREAVKNRQANIAKRLARPTRISPTVKEIYCDWLDHYGPDDIRPTTKREYERVFENHLLPFLETVQLVNLTPQRLQRLFSHDLSDRGAAARRNAHRTLKIMLGWAVSTNQLVANPILAVKSPEYKTKVRVNDEKLIDKRTNMSILLLEWLENPDCPYHDDYNRVLFSFLGLRRAELLGMTDDVITNLAKKGKANLRVQQQLQREKGKGWSIVHRTKTGKTRKIPLPELWRKALLNERSKNRVVFLSGSESKLVWVRADGKHFTFTDYNDRWRDILTAFYNRNHSDDPKPLRDDQYWRPHYNRHLTASIMFRAGETLEYVQDVLGHSSEIQTLWYSHFSEQSKREMMDTYEQALDHANWNALRRKNRI